MNRNDDTMNLDDIRALLSDVPDTDEFDLDSIIAEVEGTAPPRTKAAPAPAQPKAETPKAAPQPAQPKTEAPKAAPAPAQPKAEAPKAAPKTRAARRPAPEQTEGETEELDPREARIAAREEKARARRERAEAKAAEREARRAAKLAAEEDGYEELPIEEEPRRPAKRAKQDKMTRKEARAARRAAEQAEEAEEIQLCDPGQATRICKRRARGLSARAFLVLLLAAGAAYISLAPGLEVLPLPLALDAVENPGIGIGALILMQLLALIFGIDVFGKGFAGLFHGEPDRATLVSFAIVASILHGASIIVFDNAVGVNIPYIAVSILMLYAAMREERGRFAARARAYQAISSAEEPVAVYSHYDREDDACRATKSALASENAFLMEMERPDTVDRFSMIYVPVALAASIIGAVVASVACGEPVRFFWAFSAMLSVSAPLGLLCAFGASYKNVSRRLLGSGAAIAGARQANLLRGTEEVVLTENDLFPAGSISLEAMQNAGVLTDDKLLGCAAALAAAAHLELGRVLTAAVQERYGVALSASGVQAVEGGLVGEIGGHRMVLGTAALMVGMGHRIRSGQRRDEEVTAYLAVDNTLAGSIILRYQPTKSTYHAMRLMRRMHMNAVLAVRDFNITPAMVEEQFDLRRGFADAPDAAGVQRLLDPNYASDDAPAAILTHEGAGAYLQVLKCADKLAGAVRSALTLGAFAGICGMLIVFYLTLHNSVSALPVMNLLLYLLIWYVPVFFITQQTH